MTAQPRILIAGGGIGGLVTALWLHRSGFRDLTVFESVKEVKPLGVGINLLPHAVAELDALDLLEPLDQTGIETKDLAYFNKFGQEIWSEPRGKFVGLAYPQYSVHRGKLQMILYTAAVERLGRDRIRAGRTLSSFEQTPDGVVHAVFKDRKTGELETVVGDMLIGADGIHSVVRKSFYPDEGPPRFSGMLMWRGTTVMEPIREGRNMLIAGNLKIKFVAYPISRELAGKDYSGTKSLMNFVAELDIGTRDLPPTDWNRVVDNSVPLEPFKYWKFPWLDIPKMIENSDAIYEFPMVDRDPVKQWTFGHVTLLGDAAHPMHPRGSNGASQAIFDAAVLSECLAKERDSGAGGDWIGRALKEYEDRRMPPCAAIVLSNRKLGPEEVLEVVEHRAPNGFENLEDVVSKEELARIVQSYSKLAGFDKERLDVRKRELDELRAQATGV